MNRLFLGSAAIIVLVMGGSALAADMPVKAPILKAPPPVVSEWTSCYGGINGGWKWGRFGDSAEVPLTTGTIPGVGVATAPADRINLGRANADSGAFGGQVGCRWETPEHWVFGVEGDFDATRLHRTAVLLAPSGIGTTFVPGDIFRNRMRWESSLRFTVGHTWDRFLLYATGGIAFAEVSMDANFIPSLGVFFNGAPGLYPPSAGSQSKVLAGATFGFGTAYALSKNWELGAEYRYTTYQKGDFNLGAVAGICGVPVAAAATVACLNQNATGHKDLQTSELLVKLNYKFDWAAPVVVAKH